jgi:beta-lactam-binding protein with PASTA domain
VPSVVGLIRTHAKAELQSAGYQVDIVYQASSGAPQDTVVSQSPAGGTVLKEQGKVTIAVAKDAPSPAPATTKHSGNGTGNGNGKNSSG